MRTLVLAAVLAAAVSGAVCAQTASKSVSASGSTAQSVVYANTGGTNTSGTTNFTPSPTAPAFIVASPCMGVVSGSGTSPTIGISIGMSYKDGECEHRANAATLYTMGFPETARQIMCDVDSVRRAAAAAGEPCDKPVILRAAATAEPPPDPYGLAAFCSSLNWRNPEDRPYIETVCKPR